MNLEEFLTESQGKDWHKLLGYWTSLMPGDASLWFVNRLGEIFFATADGAIHCLVVGAGKIERLSPNKESFARMLDIPENAETWLRIRLVEGCRRAGLKLGPDECYGFKVPPALLGLYEVANLVPTNIYSHYSWLSHLTKQDEIYWTGD